MHNMEGAAWLEGLAAHYEQLARRLRETAAAVRTADALSAGTSVPDDAAGAMSISAAVRYVLSRAPAPMRQRDIWPAIQQHRLMLSTRSADPPKMIAATLSAMARSGQATNEVGRWSLVK